MRKKLRSGYTTGACAAAAAKAATMLLISAEVQKCGSAEVLTSELSSFRAKEVEIPFPDGSRVKFRIQDSGVKDDSAYASVTKDAGDDPDVTNGAEIRAEARKCGSADVQKRGSAEEQKHLTSELSSFRASELIIKGGNGVGVITKPGLPVPVGEAAINPVPRKMIRDAVLEAITTGSTEETLPLAPCPLPLLEIIISVTDGEILAKKTLNPRLGIMGGISILGTTGIVKPISSEAWTATIASSMDVARAMGHDEIVLSAGRASEKAHMKKFNLTEESYVMMGDYLEFALLEAKKHGFKKIHLCAQWAKMLKIAMATPQTHVRHGAIDIKKAVEFLKSLCSDFCVLTSEFNTAREIFDFINSELLTQNSKLFNNICAAAKRYTERIASGMPVTSHLVSYEGDIIASSE